MGKNDKISAISNEQFKQENLKSSTEHIVICPHSTHKATF